MSELQNSQVQQDLSRLQELIGDLDAATDRQHQTFVGTQSHHLMESTAELARLLAPAKRTLQNLERRLREQDKEQHQLRALQDVGAALNSSLDPNEVLNVVMDTMIEISGAERGFLMLMDEDTGDMEVQAARNIKRETISDSSEVSSTVINSVMDSGEPLVSTNAQADPRFAGQQSIINYNLRSILCIPLNMKDDTIGVIYADNRIADGIFRDADRDLMLAFANQAAVAIENARLFRQIRQQLTEITQMKTLMDDVFASIASGVITIDTEDQIALYNQAAGRILGVPGSHVESQPYIDVFAQVDHSMGNEVADLVEQVKHEGAIQNLELDLTIQKRPGITTLNLNLSPLLDVRQKARGVAMVLDDISEKKRMESVKRYLPPALVEQVRDLDAAQRPQRRELSVMFADITGFSTISENMEPETLIQYLNQYFTIAAEAINDYGGVIDKFMGDAVMALFNTQLNPQENHAEMAVRTAISMQRALEKYQATVPEDRRLFFSVGIHMGEAVAGNVGSHFRKDFTAIGDAVNLSKRLEETAQASQVVISSALYERVKEIVEVEAREPMRVKGRQALEQTYFLLDIKS